MTLSRIRSRFNSFQKQRSASTASNNSTISTNSTSRPLELTSYDDEQLLEHALKVDTSLDLQSMLDLACCQWKLKATKHHKDFSIYVHPDSLAPPQVLVIGKIHCSIEELAAILCCSTEVQLNAAMQGLYGQNFIFGSIDHLASTPDTSTQLSIKTTSFVRSQFFAKNEQWRFMEYFQQKPTRDGFTLTATSMPNEDNVPLRKAVNDKVQRLNNLTAAYLVEKTSSREGLRVLFYARFQPQAGSQQLIDVQRKMQMTRLMLFAEGVPRLADLVVRRRFGAQTLVDQSAFDMKNSRCICCTRSLLLHFGSKKKRCYLCGYYVCDRCWTLEKMEMYNGRLASIVVCRRCNDCVQTCDYSELCSRQLKKCNPVRVQRDPANGPRCGEKLVQFLQQIARDSSGHTDRDVSITSSSIEHAVDFVIKGLLHEDNQTSSSSTLRATDDEADAENPAWDEQERQCALNTLEEQLNNSKVPIEECVIANTDTRKYPLQFPENPGERPPDYPIPANEEHRVQHIAKNKLAEICAVPELDIICDLAAREMTCPTSLMTIVARDTVHVIASNVASNKAAVFARNHTMCQHLIMDSRPMLVQNPEADVRFHQIDPVAKNGMRFFCGFPIEAKDGTVLGAMCCVDGVPRDVTQSQYSSLKRLAKTASRIVQVRGLELAAEKHE